MRRIVLLSVVLLVGALTRLPAKHAPKRRPLSRATGGAATARLSRRHEPRAGRRHRHRPGRPCRSVDLTAADFELLDDGKPVPIDRVRFLGAADYSGDTTLAPIRSHEDEEREASRDDVRVYAIVLDDYHVPRMERAARDRAAARVRSSAAADRSGGGLLSARLGDRRRVQPRPRAGAQGDPRVLRPPRRLSRRNIRSRKSTCAIRASIERSAARSSTSALEGLATHLGGIKQGRKRHLRQRGFTQPVVEVRDLYRGREPGERRVLSARSARPDDRPHRSIAAPTAGEMMAMVLPAREFMRTLALETGGRAIVRNDITAALGQVIRDSRAYYLIAYESPHPDDGKFHKVTVRVKRPRAHGVRAHRLLGVQARREPVAAASLRRWCAGACRRPSSSSRIRCAPTPTSPRTAGVALMPPDGAPRSRCHCWPCRRSRSARGRVVGEPVTAANSAAPTRSWSAPVDRSAIAGVSGRLLDRRGQPLTELPVTPIRRRPEAAAARWAISAPGDYVIELTAQVRRARRPSSSCAFRRLALPAIRQLNASKIRYADAHVLRRRRRLLLALGSRPATGSATAANRRTAGRRRQPAQTPPADAAAAAGLPRRHQLRPRRRHHLGQERQPGRRSAGRRTSTSPRTASRRRSTPSS